MTSWNESVFWGSECLRDIRRRRTRCRRLRAACSKAACRSVSRNQRHLLTRHAPITPCHERGDNFPGEWCRCTNNAPGESGAGSFSVWFPGCEIRPLITTWALKSEAGNPLPARWQARTRRVEPREPGRGKLFSCPARQISRMNRSIRKMLYNRKRFSYWKHWRSAETCNPGRRIQAPCRPQPERPIQTALSVSHHGFAINPIRILHPKPQLCESRP